MGSWLVLALGLVGQQQLEHHLARLLRPLATPSSPSCRRRPCAGRRRPARARPRPRPCRRGSCRRRDSRAPDASTDAGSWCRAAGRPARWSRRARPRPRVPSSVKVILSVMRLRPVDSQCLWLCGSRAARHIAARCSASAVTSSRDARPDARAHLAEQRLASARGRRWLEHRRARAKACIDGLLGLDVLRPSSPPWPACARRQPSSTALLGCQLQLRRRARARCMRAGIAVELSRLGETHAAPVEEAVDSSATGSPRAVCCPA